MPASPPVTVTVYWVFPARVALGSRIHWLVLPLRDTTAVAAAPVAVLARVNVVAPTFWTASLNVAVMLAVRFTPVALTAGVRADTLGCGPVRNVQEMGAAASGLFARSRMPVAPPVRVAVYRVSAVRLASGFRIQAFVVPLRVTVAATGAPPEAGRRLNVTVSTPCTFSLKVAETLDPRVMRVA